MPRIPADARCFACDYLLRDLPDARCPECGRPFDPANLATVNTTGRPLTWQRLLLRPPSVPLALLALLTLLVPVWYARNPGHQFHSEVTLLSLSALTIAAGLTRLIARWAVVAHCACPRDLARPWHWRWFLSPLILLTAWLIPLNAITAFSFRYSRPALEAYAHQVMRNPAAAWPPRRVGLLMVQVTEASPTMVRFYCGPGYDGARCGYVYAPTTAPTTSDPTDGNYKHYPLTAPWYEYWDHTWPAAVAPAPPPPTTTAPATPTP